MAIHFSHLLLAFVEGLGLIISPCILPILPIMLAASLDGGRRRPLGIITGFITAFTVFALLSRQILAWLSLDPNLIRTLALGLLVLFGITLLSKKLSDKLLATTQSLANLGQRLTSRWNQSAGFLSGVGIGMLIGLIWTPCAGPIMAAAIVEIIQAQTNWEAALTVIMFALGAGIPMLLIALAGRKIMNRLEFVKKHSYAFRRGLGVIIIGMAALIYSGADVKLLAASDDGASTLAAQKLTLGLDHPYPAPDIAPTKDWINSSPLSLADLRGKVVLIDFWTYSCVNCVRTLPYITKWDEKYRNDGLVIIGVHSPEFEFEKKIDNVRKAVAQFGIHYPVVLDNNLRTWSNFKNQYWPAHYLIDKNGRVVYTHFGEGDYDATENNIRRLLGLGKGTLVQGEKVGFSFAETPETYLGYTRAQSFASVEPVTRGEPMPYSFPSDLRRHDWALSGNWEIDRENVTSKQENAALRLHFIARKVFLVLGSEDGKTIHVHVFLNKKPPGNLAGADIKDGVLTIDRERLYELIDQGAVKEGLLELHADEPGLQAYAFTFGG